MNNLKVKVITGFRKEQHYTIDAEEAHRAYYLFLNPEERGIFSNGVALVGKNIQGIEPDYHTTMGWNQTHTLDGNDWNDIRRRGIDRELRDKLYAANQVAKLGDGYMHLSLSEAASQIGLLNYSGGENLLEN